MLERILRREHDYLKSIVDTLRDPILVLDQGLRVLSANRSFYQTFQVSIKEEENELLWELGNGQWDIPALRLLLHDIASSDTSFDAFEVDHVFPTIGRKTMLLNARKIQRRNDRSVMILLAIEDITQREQAQEHAGEENKPPQTPLPFSEAGALFRLLLETTEDFAVLLLDIEGRIVTWNPGARRLTQWPASEVVGQHFSLLFSPEYRTAGVPERQLQQAENTGHSQEMHWHVRKDGTRFFADGVLMRLRDENGNFCGFAKVLRDTTQTKQADDEQREANAELQEANALLRVLATQDGLTGVGNHRAFQERLQEEHKRATRYHEPLSLLMLDVDHFKTYNDTFGHPAGDEVLQAIVHVLGLNARATDFVARCGGEEFAVILPHTDLDGAVALAERFRGAIEAAAWPKRPVTASFGVSTAHAAITHPAQLIAEADAALYASKVQGRNRVTHAELPSNPTNGAKEA